MGTFLLNLSESSHGINPLYLYASIYNPLYLCASMRAFVLNMDMLLYSILRPKAARTFEPFAYPTNEI